MVGMGVSIGTITDYRTLGKTVFLKHRITDDGLIESCDVCFMRNKQLYCLVGGDEGAAYENNKALLL